jgi:hypothetical protein
MAQIPTTPAHIVITERDGMIEYRHIEMKRHEMPLACMYRKGRKWIGDDMGMSEMGVGGKRAAHAFCMQVACEKSDWLNLTWEDENYDD